jgi:hypothetical protein
VNKRYEPDDEPDKELDAFARAVIGAAIEVHRMLGLLINFNVPVLKNGIKRVALSRPSHQ